MMLPMMMMMMMATVLTMMVVMMIMVLDDECGDDAGAKAISQCLPKLLFVPPQEKGRLANFGKATLVL